MMWAFVWYTTPEALWHQRLLLGVLASSVTRFIVVTPDGQVYDEEFGPTNSDVAGIRFSVQRWPPPPGVTRALCYRFAAQPGAAAIAGWTAEATAHAVALHTTMAALPALVHGSATPLAAPAAVAALPGAPPAGGAVAPLGPAAG